MKRLHALDSLRGIAALLIVVWHWQHFFAIRGEWMDGWRPSMEPLYVFLKPLYLEGWAAVDLFFVLSGFVFFWLYGDAIRTGTIGALRFGQLRFSRLYPLHFVLLILVAVLQIFFIRQTGVFFVYRDTSWHYFIAHLFMVQNWWPGSAQTFDGPSWSVSIEVLLYAVFFLACRAGLKKSVHILMVALAGGVLLRFDEHIGRGVIGFFMGGVAFTLWDRLRESARAASIVRWLVFATLAGWGVLLGLLYLDSPWLIIGETNIVFLIVFDFLLCPLTVLTLALREAVRGEPKISFGYLGDISYGTYMLHFPLQLMLALVALRFDLAPAFFMRAWVMIAFYAVLIGLATLSYRYFERPMQAWLRDAGREKAPEQEVA